MAIFSYSDIEWIRLQHISDRSRYLNKWSTASEFLSPRRFNNTEYDRNMGQRKDQRIINNLARRSLRTFVSGMMNGATPRSRPWFNLTTLSESKRNATPVKRYFREVESIFNSFFQVSNLYRVLPMAYKDVGTFSNAAYAMLPHPRFGFYFQPFAVGTFCFSSDSEGNVTTFIRDFTLTVRQTVEIYGVKKETGQIDWTTMDSWVKEAWDAARYNDLVHLTNVILPNPKPKRPALFSRDKPYQSYTYIRSLGGGIGAQVSTRRSVNSAGDRRPDGIFISVKGYDYFPVITPRWEVGPEQDYGDEGPGELALGDVQTLQELEKSRLEAIQKLVKPPMVGPASLRRVQASILAGGITYLDEVDKKQFRPAFTMDPKIVELINAKVDYEQSIKSAFFEDLFMMLADERKISHVTAREIEERSAEKLSALGPVLGQLDQDQNRRLIDNAFIILGQREGLMPEKPKELEGEEVRPEYVSILAQAQKASLITASEKLVSFTSATAQNFQDPSVLKIIKSDLMVRQYAEYLGIDPRLIRDELEFAQIQDQMQRLEAQARANAQAEQQSNTAKNLSQAKVGEGSLLDQQLG